MGLSNGIAGHRFLQARQLHVQHPTVLKPYKIKTTDLKLSATINPAIAGLDYLPIWLRHLFVPAMNEQETRDGEFKMPLSTWKRPYVDREIIRLTCT